jgi:hypothetical protein
MRWMVIYEYEVSGRALNLSSTKLPRPWSPWDLPLQGKLPMAEPGIFVTIIDRFDRFDLSDLLVVRVTNMGQIILLFLPKEGML